MRWRVRVGAPWRDVPDCYGSWQADGELRTDQHAERLRGEDHPRGIEAELCYCVLHETRA